MMIRGAIFGTITDGRELLACSIDTGSIDNIDSSSKLPCESNRKETDEVAACTIVCGYMHVPDSFGP
jgi:hypothetical protein